MKARTLQVTMHAKEGAKNDAIFSLDFHPSLPLLATAGADTEIKLWRLVDRGGEAAVEYVLTLTGHAKTVNCVRWSPNGECLASVSDDSTGVVWHPPPSAVPGEVARAWGSLTSERQLARQFLKRHQNDVYDVAWSPCSSRLITGSVDNSCIVWDVARGREIATLEGHSHYVQGVAWDPAGAFLVSQSSDRSMRVYRENTPLAQAHCKGKRSVAKVMTQIARAGGIGTKLYVCVQAIKAVAPLSSAAPSASSYSSSSSSSFSSSSSSSSSSPPAIADAAASSAPPGAAPTAPTVPAAAVHVPVAKHHAFLDDTLATFFRRPAWTPDGSLLFAPAASSRAAAGSAPRPTTFAFARGRFDAPIASFPAAAAAKASIVVRASPVLYRLRAGAGAGAAPSSSSSSSSSPSSYPSSSSAASPSPSPPSASAAPQAPPAAAGDNGAFALRYRMLVAVATLDSVVVYDTQSAHPVAAVANFHLDKLTDLAWAASGLVLMMSSVDGYCSALTFDAAELGERLPADDEAYPAFLRERARAHAPTFQPPKPKKERAPKAADKAAAGEPATPPKGAEGGAGAGAGASAGAEPAAAVPAKRKIAPTILAPAGAPLPPPPPPALALGISSVASLPFAASSPASAEAVPILGPQAEAPASAAPTAAALAAAEAEAEAGRESAGGAAKRARVELTGE